MLTLLVHSGKPGVLLSSPFRSCLNHQRIGRGVRKQKLNPFDWHIIVFFYSPGGGTGSRSVPNSPCWLHYSLINGEHYSVGSRWVEDVQEFVLGFVDLFKRNLKFTSNSAKKILELLNLIGEGEIGITALSRDEDGSLAGSGKTTRSSAFCSSSSEGSRGNLNASFEGRGGVTPQQT